MEIILGVESVDKQGDITISFKIKMYPQLRDQSILSYISIVTMTDPIGYIYDGFAAYRIKSHR